MSILVTHTDRFLNFTGKGKHRGVLPTREGHRELALGGKASQKNVWEIRDSTKHSITQFIFCHIQNAPSIDSHTHQREARFVCSDPANKASLKEGGSLLLQGLDSGTQAQYEFLLQEKEKLGVSG